MLGSHPKFDRVMTVTGDQAASPYVREGWIIVDTHLHDERMQGPPRTGGPTPPIRVLTIYILGHPAEEPATQTVEPTPPPSPVAASTPRPAGVRIPSSSMELNAATKDVKQLV